MVLIPFESGIAPGSPDCAAEIRGGWIEMRRWFRTAADLAERMPHLSGEARRTAGNLLATALDNARAAEAATTSRTNILDQLLYSQAGHA